ncbi:hypothetical protein HOB87_02795 [Candidatus Woesearchaeota archaeon]|nr:hypothetical protein [Candidatus Woesearchaeota archaeon]
MKRGQIVGMPIVYIMVAVTMGLVLYFGFVTMGNLIESKDITHVSKFVLDFEDEVEVMGYYDIGSSKKFESIALPSSVEYVCFYNPSNEITIPYYELIDIDDELEDYLDVSLRDNLFLIPLGAYGPPYPDYYIENLVLDDKSINPLCVSTTNGVELVLETYLKDNQVVVGVKDE